MIEIESDLDRDGGKFIQRWRQILIEMEADLDREGGRFR